MIDKLENTKSTQKNSIHRKIGLGIYIIFALIYYFFMKDMFLDGTFFLIVGIEPPRDCRRLNILREYDNEKTNLHS